MVPRRSFVYEAADREACARCHEIGPQVDAWQAAQPPQRRLRQCHGDALTLDARST